MQAKKLVYQILKGEYDSENTLFSSDVEVIINRSTQNSIGVQLPEHCNAFISEEIE